VKNKRLNIGFIGGGVNSAIGTTHKIASQMDNNFKLVSGAFSQNRTINQESAIQWNVGRYYDDYKMFLQKESDNIDAVVILTPTDTHADIIMDVLKYNLPIVCEKTLTTSSQEAVQIKHILEENQGFLLTTYNYTGYPMIRELKNMIECAKLGQILHINIEMPQESFIRLTPEETIPMPQKWRLKDHIIPTLSLDLGTHLSNMVYFLINKKPLEAIAMHNSFGHHNVIDNLTALIKYEDNIDCQMWYSKSALGHKNGLRVEIYGTKGSASWYQMNPEFLEFNDNLGRNIVLDRSSKDISIANQTRYNRFKTGHPAGFIEAFSNHYHDIYLSLQNYKQGSSNATKMDYVFDINHSIEGLKLMEAINLSTKTKTWERVNDAKN